MNPGTNHLHDVGKFILVVDDDRITNAVTTRILSRAGYDAVSAYNWKSACRTIQELRPNLVILDVALPDANGVEKCREMMRDTSTNDIPIIMVCGFGEQPIRQSAFLAGALQFIHKPDLQRVLLKEIGNAFRKTMMRNAQKDDASRFQRDPRGFLLEFISNTTN